MSTTTTLNGKIYDFIYFSNSDYCRLCWTKSCSFQNNGTLYDFTKDCKTFSAKVLFCLDVDLDLDSKESTPQICEACYYNVEAFHSFKIFCKEADTKLRELITKYQSTYERGLKEETSNTQIKTLVEILPEVNSNEPKEESEDIKTESYDEDYDRESLSVDESKDKITTSVCRRKKRKTKSKRTKEKQNKKFKHKPQDPTYCIICKKDLHSVDLYLEHNKDEHDVDKKGFKCFACQKLFKNRRNRNYHEERSCKLMLDGYECTDCKRFLPNREMYEQHLINHKQNLDISLPDDLFQCFYCNKSFEKKYDLQAHKVTHKYDKTFKEQCLKLKTYTKADISNQDLLDMNNEEDGDDLKCFGCESTFKSSQRRHHHEKHSCEALKDGYKCPICNAVLPNRKLYVVHERKHRIYRAPKDIFECASCQLTFKTRPDLIQHRRTHVKNFICEICGRIFKLKVHLQRHILIHTGAKPYSCPYCKFRAAQQASLTYHVRRHTGEKPFRCDLCPQRCASSGNLAAHKLRHAGIKRFECTLCTNKFARKSSLANHMAYVHEGLRAHSCDACGATYARPNGLRRHIKEKHSKIGPAADVGQDSHLMSEASQL